MITTILFDIYGTLIDITTDEGDPFVYSTLSKWLEYKCVYLSPDQIRWYYREEFDRRLGEAGVAPREQDVFKEIIDEFALRTEKKEIFPDADVREVFKSIVRRSIDLPAEELEHVATDLSHLFRACSRKRIFLYPTVKPALDEMQKRYRLGIVSNAQEAFTIPELSLFGLNGYFESIVLSSMVGVKKPNSRIFERVLQELNVQPENAVFVGNDMKADIMGARKLGMRTIYLSQKPGAMVRGVIPDAVIANVNMLEVLTQIERWNMAMPKR